MFPCSVSRVVLITQTFGYNLKKLLRILLLPTYPLFERLFQNQDKWPCRYGLLVYGPLVQRIEDILQSLGNCAGLQPLYFPSWHVLPRRILHQLRIDFRSIKSPSVRFSNKIYPQIPQSCQRLEDRVYEAIIRRVGQPNYGLLARAGGTGRRLSIDEEGRGKDVDKSDGRQ